MHLSINLLKFQTDVILGEQSQIFNKKQLASSYTMTATQTSNVHSASIQVLLIPLLSEFQHTKVVWKFLLEISEINQCTNFRAKISVHRNSTFELLLFFIFFCCLRLIMSINSSSCMFCPMFCNFVCFCTRFYQCCNRMPWWACCSIKM